MVLDVYSVLMANMVVDLIATLAFSIIYIENRRRYQGLGHFLLNLVLQVLGITCILLRPVTGKFVALVVGNALILASCVALISGFQLYRQVGSSYKLNLSILGLFVMAATWFTEIYFSAELREISLAVCIVFYEVQLILLIKGPKVGLPGNSFLVAAFAGYVFASVVRAITNSLFLLGWVSVSSNAFIDAITVIAYSALSILVAVGLILLITRRLVYDVQRQEIIYERAFHSAPYGLLMTELSNGRIISANEGFEKITGYSQVDCFGKDTLEINLWQDARDREQMLERITVNRKISGWEVALQRKDGSQIVGLLSCEIASLPEGEMLVSNIADVTELVQIKKELHEKATHDFLTGLPNRFLFYDRFSVAKAYAERNAGRIAILALDLDHFKKINDTFGHEVGDLVLVEISKRFQKCLRRMDTLARFGGDEFVVMLQGVREDEDAANVAAKLIKEAQDPIVHNDQVCEVGVSIGISFYPEQGSDINVLLQKSDAALYASKNAGRNTWKMNGVS
jgi:diguanylate cyclase (GGDEF)-like protein/PAS domain S-box-containing protein